jgi:hypothetical protein
LESLKGTLVPHSMPLLLVVSSLLVLNGSVLRTWHSTTGTGRKQLLLAHARIAGTELLPILELVRSTLRNSHSPPQLLGSTTKFPGELSITMPMALSQVREPNHGQHLTGFIMTGPSVRRIHCNSLTAAPMEQVKTRPLV